MDPYFSFATQKSLSIMLDYWYLLSYIIINSCLAIKTSSMLRKIREQNHHVTICYMNIFIIWFHGVELSIGSYTSVVIVIRCYFIKEELLFSLKSKLFFFPILYHANLALWSSEIIVGKSRSECQICTNPMQSTSLQLSLKKSLLLQHKQLFGSIVSVFELSALVSGWEA